MYWLPYAELPDGEAALSTSPGSSCAFKELSGARLLSKLDLRSVYNIIRIREGDEWKISFITPADYYEFRVMQNGLANSPSVFQGFMNEVFW